MTFEGNELIAYETVKARLERDGRWPTFFELKEAMPSGVSLGQVVQIVNNLKAKGAFDEQVAQKETPPGEGGASKA